MTHRRFSAAMAAALVASSLLFVTTRPASAGSNPTCTLIAPASGAAVRGTAVGLNATATNAVSVKYYLNGSLIGSGTNTIWGWLGSWNSTTTPDGTYSYTCVATASDNTTGTSSPQNLAVDNTPPTVSIQLPAQNAVVMGGNVAFDAFANDAGSGISSVQFSVDGQVVGTAPYSAFGYVLNWNSLPAAAGAHTVTATATDIAGNTTVAGPVSITVPNPNIASPGGPAAVRGSSVLLSSVATSVTGVEYYLNGTTDIGPGVSTPYGWLYSHDNGQTYGWDSTTTPDGTYTLTAVGAHSDGSHTTSGGVALTVDNTAPSATLTAPSGGSQLSGVSVPFSATASDGQGSGVTQVQFAIDGTVVGNAHLTQSTWTFTWNSERVFNGTHSLTAVATDAAGNTGTSAPVSVTVTNTVQLLAQELGVASGASPPGNPPILNNTVNNYKVNAADLGITWDDGQGHLLMAFGDTAGAGWTGPGTTGSTDGRSNTLARSSDTNLSDGLTFDTMIQDTPGHAKQVIPFDRTLANEVAVTPTAGISVGTRQYVFYVSQRRNNKDTNYAGFAYSDDDGATWTRDPNAIWLQNAQLTDPFQYGSLVASGGYVYLLGTPAYRDGGVSVARVASANVLTKSAWQYWDGTTWQTNNEAAAVTVIPATVGEASVWYSTATSQWVFIYTTMSQGIQMRTAPNLTGPWSTPSVLVNEYSGVYGGYILPWSSGHDVYFTVSMWGPYAVFLFHTTV